MDPKRCLSQIHNAIEKGNQSKAWEHICAYRAWRRKGGFAPSINGVSGDVIASMLDEEYRKKFLGQFRSRVAV